MRKNSNYVDSHHRMSNYIVVVSPFYGGAEKRFFDIFRALRAQGEDVVFIAPSTLAEPLLADFGTPELGSAILSIDLPVWSRKKFIVGFLRLLSTLPRGSCFHYPMNCLWPLHLRRGDRVTMSVTDCVKVPGPLSSNHAGLWTWLSFFFVDRIDVLSPAVLSQMRDYRMARKMSLTPGGTFLEAVVHTGQPRRPTVVLLNRLVAEKGIDNLLDVLPQVWAAFRDRAPSGTCFEVAGYGPMQSHVIQRVGALARSGVPVSFVGYVDAAEFLSRSAVVLSMQEVTNYPSRVVAEALVLGCAVIVRNTGDSMQFGADMPGLSYCGEALDPLELSHLIANLLNRVMVDKGFSNQIAQAAQERFCSNASIAYFRAMLIGQEE